MNRISTAALLFTPLGLTACTSQVPPQAQYRPTALIEVHYTVNGDDVSTEVIPVPAARISRQGYQEALNFPTLTVLGSTGIKDKTTQTLHLTGMYKFTNTFGRTLINAVVVPVNLDDTDGNTTNNATSPTAGLTPYKSLTYFNGTDASSLATLLSPQQGKIVNLKTGDVISDPEATGFGTVDLTGATLTPPAGLTANIYGTEAWQLGDIPAGSTAYLTMGHRKTLAVNPTQELYTYSLVAALFEQVN